MFYQNQNIFKSGYLKVNNNHQIYYETYGNPKKKAIFYLHGGPGSGFKSKNANFFNPEKFFVIMFDQRGSGKSLSKNILFDNKTENLIEDIEKLRNFFNLKKINLYGTSWGSCLALAYSQKYPQNIENLILRALFLGSQKEILYEVSQRGLGRFYPQNFQKLSSFYQNQEGISLIKKIFTDLKNNKKEGIKLFLNYLIPALFFPEKINLNLKIEQKIINALKIEFYYKLNNCFLDKNGVITNKKIIKDLNIYLIHGEKDLLCPVNNAYEFKKNFPQTKLKIIKEGGHKNSEKFFEELIKIFNQV
jgi:proline iminopeptidase